MQPFNQHKFLGYVSEVTPGFVKMQLPSALHLGGFYHDGEIYNGGNVGGFVVIEGNQFGFLVEELVIHRKTVQKNKICAKSDYRNIIRSGPIVRTGIQMENFSHKKHKSTR